MSISITFDNLRDGGASRALAALHMFSDRPDLEYSCIDENISEWARNKHTKIAAMMSHPNYNFNEPYKLVFNVEAVRKPDVSAAVLTLKNSMYMAATPNNPAACVARYILECAEDENSTTVTDWAVGRLSLYLDGVHPDYPRVKGFNVGAKYSRVLRKFLTANGFTFAKDSTFVGEYMAISEAEYAKFADAMNPTTFKRKYVISADPADYLLMSHGNSWASCYAINTDWGGHDGSSYRGAYSVGTWSYMTDAISLIGYVVNDNVTSDYAFAEKIYRQVIMFDDCGEMLHSRIYPSQDHNEELYKEFRAYAQRAIAEIYNMPNDWAVVKGTYDFRATSNYRGYDDTVHFPDVPRVSKAKSPAKMAAVSHKFGGVVVCPNCGGEIDDECGGDGRYICSECDVDGITCAGCGCCLDPDYDEYEYIDGEYYCHDCCTYCDYHEEWEINDNHNFEEVHVRWGNVTYCDDAIDSAMRNGEIWQCCDCGEYYAARYDWNRLDDDADEVFCDECFEREMEEIREEEETDEE